MSNKIDLRVFLGMFEEYKKTDKETIELKTSLMNDLIEYIKESDIKMQILLSNEYKLVTELRKRGVKEEEIRRILGLKEE